MAGKHLPQQRQDALVGEYGFPGWFDPARRRLRKFGAEGVVEHPFPGIELEGEFDVAIVEIDKADAVLAPADIGDIDDRGGEPSLRCCVFEISKRAVVLAALGEASEM